MGYFTQGLPGLSGGSGGSGYFGAAPDASQEPLGGSPGPLSQYRPRTMASFDRKWTPAIQVLAQQGVPQDVWAPIMEIDLQRASSGQNVLSANDTMQALQAAMTGESQTERPKGNIIERGFRDIRQTVSAIPKMPGMFVNEALNLHQAPGQIATAVAEGDLEALTEARGVRMLPGAFTVGNIVSDERSVLDHPVLSLLDVSPFISKGLAQLPKTKAASAALAEEGALLKSTPYRTTAREYLMKPRAARYEAKTGRPYEGVLTKFGLSSTRQGELAKQAAVRGRKGVGAYEQFVDRITEIGRKRDIPDDRIPIIHDAAQKGRLGELSPNEAAYATELEAEIQRLAEQEGAPLYQETKGKEGLIEIDGEWYDARSGVGQKVTKIDKSLKKKDAAISTLGPKVAGIRHGRAYMNDLIEGNPFWDAETGTFATPDGRISSVPFDEIVNDWASTQRYPERGMDALGRMMDEFGEEGARLQIERMHDDYLRQSVDDVVAGEIAQEIAQAGEKVILKGKPAEQFLDIAPLNYGDITSPHRAIMEAVQGMGPINAALEAQLGRPTPLLSAFWDMPEGAGPVDTPMFRLDKNGNYEATPELYENWKNVRRELETNLELIPDDEIVKAGLGKRGSVVKKRILETFDLMQRSTDNVAMRANEALRNRLYRNTKSRAKMIEGYIERGDIRTAAVKAAEEVAWIDDSLEKIRATLLEDPALKAVDDAAPPVTPHEIRHSLSPLDYGDGPGRALRMEIHDPSAPPQNSLNFAGSPDSLVAFLDYSPGWKRPNETYIHFVTARPEFRGRGMPREMVEQVYRMTDEKIDWGKIEAPEAEVLRRRMAREHPDRGNYGKPQRGIVDKAERLEASNAEKRIAAREAKTAAAQKRKARVEGRSDTYALIRDEYMAERNKWMARADELREIGDFLKARKTYQDKAKQLPIQEKRLAERIAEREELLDRRFEVLERTPPASYEPLVQETALRFLKERHAEKYAEEGTVATRLAEAGEVPPEVDWAEVTIRMEEGLPVEVPGLSRAEISATITEARKTWMELREVSPNPPVFTHSVNMAQASQLGTPMKPLARQEITPTAWKGKTIDPSPTIKNLEISVLHQGREIIQQVIDRDLRDWVTNESGWVKSGETVFAEYENIARRMIESGYRLEKGTSVGTLANELIQKEMTLWNPKSLTPLTKGHLTRANKANAMYVPKWFDEAMNAMYPSSRSALGGVLDRVHQAFRLSILPLSPRWHINNIIGGAVMLMAEGGPGAFRHWGAARKLLKAGELPDEIARGAGNVPAADAAWGLATGRELGRIWENEQFRKIAQTGGKVSEGFKTATDFSFDIGEKVDKFYRSMAYLQGKTKGERLGLSHDAARKAGIELADRVLQDWDRMTPVERSVIRMVFPFYGWMKHIMRYTYGLAVDHPTRTAIMANFSRNEIEDWGTGIPERFFQMFVLGEPDANGTIQSNLSLNPFNISGAINMKGTNPFSDVGNYMTLAGFVGQLSPVGSGFLEAMGINSATGTANLYPDTAYNEVLGRNVAKQTNPGLAILRNVIPQFDVVLDKIGMTPAELRNLKQNDPDLYSQRMLSSVGIPFLPRDINMQREAALAEIARHDDQTKAMNEALRTGNWDRAMQYPDVARLLQVLQSMPRSAVEPFLIGQRPKLSA